MKFLAIIAVITVLVALWVTTIRPRLRQSTRPWVQRFFAWIEPIEMMLWRKSETILFARFKMLLGLLITLLTNLGTLDLTPLLPFVPDQYESLLKLVVNMSPMLLVVLGFIDEQLRKDTTKPIEVAELPQAVIENDPVLSNVVADLEQAKVVAVATIKEAV